MTWQRIRECALLCALAVLIGFAYTLGVGSAFGRDTGQWGDSPGEWNKWFATLMWPDKPNVPCCGESDAYWADSFEIKGDRYVAIITDERDDAPLGRPHIDAGTRIEIPNHKIKYDKGNPTGHGIVFVSEHGTVYCYLPPGGV